jgi:thioredoxin 1
MAASPNVHEFNELNFETEVMASEVPVLVDFTATWCGPCKMLAPIVEKLADDFVGKVKVGKLDIDANPGISAKFGIRGVPTCIVFQGGQRKAQVVGLVNRDKLEKLLGLNA